MRTVPCLYPTPTLGYNAPANPLIYRCCLASPRLILNGLTPAVVADSVIDEIKARERGGLVELPKREAFHVGDTVRVTCGPLAGQLGLFAGMRAHERVLVLLALLGAQQRVELPKGSIEAL